MRSTRLLPCGSRNLPSGSSAAVKDGGHDDIRFVVRRFTRAEHCRHVCPRFVIEIAIANEQVDVHPLSSPLLPKRCRLSGKVCVGHLYGPFGLIRADLNELVRVAPPCSSGPSHRAWNRIARTCTLLVRVEPRKSGEIGGLRCGRPRVQPFTDQTASEPTPLSRFLRPSTPDCRGSHPLPDPNPVHPHVGGEEVLPKNCRRFSQSESSSVMELDD